MPKELADQARLIYNVFRRNEKVLVVVLDACNWRVLLSLRPHWDIRVVRSRGSCTAEWLERSFTEPLKDVIYISSNPYTHALKDMQKKFKRIVDLCLICWDKRLQTVRPRTMNFFVRENIISGKTKIIVHYMQPHAPFLTDSWLNVYSNDYREEYLVGEEIYKLAQRNFDARKEFKRAYIKNLQIVITYAESLIKYVKNLDMSFKAVITSDHSEILNGLYNPFMIRKKIWLWIPWVLGIYRFIGHEPKSRLKQLYEVPWIVF